MPESCSMTGTEVRVPQGRTCDSCAPRGQGHRRGSRVPERRRTDTERHQQAAAMRVVHSGAPDSEQCQRGVSEESASGQARSRRRCAVCFIGLLDLLSRDPQQIERGVQIRHIDCGVGLFAHDRLRVERDSETCGGEHV